MHEYFEVISAEEFQRDPDACIERAKQEKRPIRIREQDGREVVLTSWEQSQKIFGKMHEDPGEEEKNNYYKTDKISDFHPAMMATLA